MKVNRSTVYYKPEVDRDKKEKQYQEDLIKVFTVFKENRKKYGSRKIKIELAKEGTVFSKRKIRRIMNKTAELVKKAFDESEIDFRKMMIFHTDRGREFDNRIIDEVLDEKSGQSAFIVYAVFADWKCKGKRTEPTVVQSESY